MRIRQVVVEPLALDLHKDDGGNFFTMTQMAPMIKEMGMERGNMKTREMAGLLVAWFHVRIRPNQRKPMTN